MRAAILLLATLTGAAALAACGSGGTKTVVVTEPGTTQQTLPQTQTATTATVTVTTQTTTAPSTSPPSATVHRRFFKSPSGNIGCAIGGGDARCDIRQRDWSPTPKPASCDVDWGQGLVVSGGSAGFVCAGDTTLDPSFPVLPYGQDSQVGAITCASRTAGVTCTNHNTGHGFFLARQSYRFF